MYEEDDEDLLDAESATPSQAPQGALARVASTAAAPTGDMFGGLAPEALMAEARKFANPRAPSSAMAAGFLKPTSSGKFSESFGNALGAYDLAKQREDALVQRYLPIVQRAAQQRQMMQLQAVQQARAMLDNTASAALMDPELSHERLAQQVGGLAAQGRVPGALAESFLASLPRDPAQLRRTLTQQALARADPLRAVQVPRVEKYREGEVGYEVSPVTGERKEVGSGRAKPTELSRMFTEMMQLDPKDTKTREVYANAIRRLTTHPPAAHMSVNTGKAFAETFADNLAKTTEASRDAAASARASFETAGNLLNILDSGKVLTGPGAPAGRLLGRIAELGNWGGKDNRERLANTANAIREMAQLELAAAGQMKGQGAITEAERALLKKAASGDISDDIVEIRALAIATQNVAMRRIRRYNDTARRVGQMPGMGNMLPILLIDEPDYQDRALTIDFDKDGNPIRPRK